MVVVVVVVIAMDELVLVIDCISSSSSTAIAVVDHCDAAFKKTNIPSQVTDLIQSKT